MTDKNHWFTDSQSQSLTDLFLNELNQQYDPDNLPSTIPIAGSSNNYVALGDSYSAGQGNPPFLTSGTYNSEEDGCHRSDAAYPVILGKDIGLTPEFYACSGAKTENITSVGMDSEPYQLKEPGVNSTASLVTLTIGGNDAGFASVLTTCARQDILANAVYTEDPFSRIAGGISDWLGLGLGASCADSHSFVNSVNTNIDKVLTPAENTYKAILKQTSADNTYTSNTSVIAADYPLLFPTTTAAQDACFQISPLLTSSDQSLLNKAGNNLDNVFQTAASYAGVNFVDVRSIFAGHGVCGNGSSGSAWINGFSNDSGDNLVGSFHPDASGQSEGYAAAFKSYIDSPLKHTSSGFPVNPASVTDPPATTGKITDQVQDLTVTPVTAETPGCEETYQAGQELSISGDGFTPGGAVKVYVTSPGLGPSDEQEIGQFTADANGHIAETIRIPLTATGFPSTGSSNGLVFIDAIGLGLDGVHADDNDMVSLAPRTSSCGTVEQLPFKGFYPPVANLPKVNDVKHHWDILVRFSMPGIDKVPNSDVLASGYPQSAPVSCTDPGTITSGDPTVSVKGNTRDNFGDSYNYIWKTDPSWRGCRELVVKLVDGTYHQAVFDFRGDNHKWYNPYSWWEDLKSW